GDGVANIDLQKLHHFHLSHKKMATVSAVRPPSRFGELVLKGSQVKRFIEQPYLWLIN
ncbi:MAG: glucose-1-phosphate cytidylyltransferase, partial [Chloroflexota bacterium]